MKHCYCIIFLVIFFVLLGGNNVFAVKQSVEEDLTCKTLMLKKCDDCHYMTRVCYEVGKKSTRKWKRVMKKMVRRGMKITKKEELVLLECLGNKVAESKQICDEYLKR